ncbi:MAG: hypothetical protein NZ821_09695, partial [Gloeomargarita sp. SKYB31]|nr:hypothetical protein [Gloeomargarita sp. SKYB31]
MYAGLDPHGGVLINRLVSGQERALWEERTRTAPRIPLSERAMSDVEMIATGGFSPLTGFMNQADYQAVVETMHLPSGLPWSMPITLGVSETLAASLREGMWVRLHSPQGLDVGVMEIQDIYRPDREREAQKVYKTTEMAHPGVQALYEQGPVYLGGPLWVW